MSGVPVKVNYGNGILTEVQMVQSEMDIIAQSIKDMALSGTMIEWGSGGSTLKWLETMTESQNLISIEHTDAWYTKVRRAVSFEYGKWPERFVYLNKEEKYIEHGYGSPMEEHPMGCAHYINPKDPDIWNADIYLIDGIARAACLMAVMAKHKKLNPVIYIHDYVGREQWYDWATQYFDVEYFTNVDPNNTLARFRLKE